MNFSVFAAGGYDQDRAISVMFLVCEQLSMVLLAFIIFLLIYFDMLSCPVPTSQLSRGCHTNSRSKGYGHQQFNRGWESIGNGKVCIESVLVHCSSGSLHRYRLGTEGDNAVVIGALQGKIDVPWQIKTVIEDLQSMLQQIVHSQVMHIYREANMAADWLSKFGHSISDTWSATQCTSIDFVTILQDDRIGRTLVRRGS